jgi:elongation factor Ts
MKIDIKNVKILREKTQAGYADCKKALLNSDNNIEKAEEYLREKGRAIIDRDVTTKTECGVIESYIHPGNRVGTIVEVKCQTDFVAKTDEFKNFAKEISMQVASMKPRYISRADIPLDIISKEVGYRIERLKREGAAEEDLQMQLDAEMEQWYSDICLLEQSYIRDSKKAVKDLLAELISKTDEACKVTKFERWEVGMDEEKKPVMEEKANNLNRFYLPVSAILIVMVLFILISIFGDC